MDNPKPLVSIFSVVKNGAYTIRRCVESVLSQDYSNIEFIIQDGASTDGTLEVLKKYATKYEGRIKLVSEPDSCGGEGFYRALRRCTGDIIGSCLSDEELLPHAVSWAVEQFEHHPDAGAVYGDYYTTDIDGNVTKENKAVPFDLSAYLLHEIVPPFCSSFFKRSAFENIRIFGKDLRFDVGEFEIWVRMGLKYPIYYEPGVVSKYATHPGSNTSKPAVMLSLISGRLEEMRKVFSDEATPAQIRAMEQQGYAGLHLWIANTIVHLGAYEEAAGQIRQALAYQPNAQRLGSIFRCLPKTISAYYVLERQVREYMNESALVAPAAPGGVSSTNPVGDSQKQRLEMFRGWIDTLTRVHNRLYYRDQTPASLNILVELVERYKPTKIVEMGTLSGLSLRTWLATNANLKVIAIDLSFKDLHESTAHLPLDLSRVTLLEQDILQTNFPALWRADERVLLYVDAHDLQGVPIMEYVLQKTLPFLPPGSAVAVDDLWYSPDRLSPENARRFFEQTIIHEIDSLQCFTGYYAPYWKGGSFFGFREVLPLMHWAALEQVELHFEPPIKIVHFDWQGGRA